jgi:hypothetical protein
MAYFYLMRMVVDDDRKYVHKLTIPDPDILAIHALPLQNHLSDTSLNKGTEEA